MKMGDIFSSDIVCSFSGSSKLNVAETLHEKRNSLFAINFLFIVIKCCALNLFEFSPNG